jgi:hypothetical protein
MFLLMLTMLPFPEVARAATAPLLGTASAFAVLGASTVTNTNPTVVHGELGVSPGLSVVGFPPGVVTGTIQTGILSNAGPAQADAMTAYTGAAGQACLTNLTGQDLGGLTLTPGVYCFDSSADLTGTLTLDFLGNPAAIFVFQIGSTLTTASNASVVAINGSPSCHQVFWQVGSSATLGTTTDFLGDILALASITLNTGVTSAGSMIALNGAVTMDTNTVGACFLALCDGDTPCADDGNGCTDDVCDPADPGADGFGCIHPANTASCDDGLFCTGNDTCSGAACLGGAAIDCDDANVCTTDTCDDSADSCVSVPNSDSCSDGLFCNGDDVCAGGSCTHSGDPCAGGGICGDACNEAGDSCFDPAGTVCRAALGACDLAEACTGASADCPADMLVAGGTICRADTGACDLAEVCTGVTADCPFDAFEATGTACGTDGNVCTDDACDGAGVCAHTNNTATCDDGQLCNGADVCSSGICTGAGTGPLTCGDGVLDSACGEQCDEPGAETCNNGVDDDGDGLQDCLDPDCVVPGFQSCSVQCELVPPCTAILKDPAFLYPSEMDTRAARTGSFRFHGRIVPTTPADPQLEAFLVTITNDNGVIYRAELPPGALAYTSKRRYVYRNTDRESLLESGGIERMFVRRRRDAGETGYGLRLRAFGDFSRATLPRMTTQVYLGDDVAYLTANWKFVQGRWRLTMKDY